MTDNELILKYVNRYYSVVVTDDVNICYSGTIIPISVNGKHKLSLELKTVFGEPINVNNLIDDWVLNELDKSNPEISNFIRNCKLVNDTIKWKVIHEDHGDIDNKMLDKYFTSNTPIKAVFRFFQDWYLEEVSVRCKTELLTLSPDEVALKYINTFYYLNITDVDVSIHQTKTDYKVDDYNVINELKKNLGDIVDFKRVVNEWVMGEIEKYMPHMSQFLNDCEIILGPTNWKVVHKLYGTIDDSMLDKYFTVKIPSKIATYLYNKWYSIEVFAASEREMYKS